ncbi:hypothetical protein NE237_008255 [Protea cynaroides]|uniref:Uncharacterized protein n=1 Tax=Protea cynaroides TaxID=273540 RepID=A0A9Q0JT45_9MAGN|nr:hypothetical protein NE237_008255 [Protea cynaroides]
MHHTPQEHSVTSHPVGKNADGNGSNMAAEPNQEEVEGEELQNDPPRVEDTRSKEKSSFSLMLQNRSWKNLNGKFPNRVRKKSPLVLDPTRSLDSLDPQRLQPVLCPERGHLSCLEGLSNGPAPVSSGLCAQSNPSPQFRNVFSKSPFPLLPRPALSNRFRILEVENDMSLSDPTTFPAVSCFSQLAPNTVPSPEAISAQPSDPLPNPLHPLAQKSSSRDLFSLCGEPTCLESVLAGSSPTTPSPGKSLPDPEPSSIGRTPYPSRSCLSPCSMLSGHLSFKQTSRKNFVGITSVGLEKLTAPAVGDPWYEDGKDDDMFMMDSD